MYEDAVMGKINETNDVIVKGKNSGDVLPDGASLITQR